VSTPDGAFQRLWLLVHFGLFLMWQPFFATESELDVASMSLLLLITAGTIYFVSGWMIAFWLLLLLGILGGRVFTIHAARRSRFYLVAFAYVLTMLLLWVVPELVLKEHVISETAGVVVRRGLPLILIGLVVLPFPREEDAGQVFDFFYAVLVFQLCVVLAVGSIASMRFTNDDYVESMLVTLLGFGAALFVFAALWSPVRGFGGLRTYFSRYLMSVGMPFELWMRRIAELAQDEPEPRRFLEEALREIAGFPWIRGGRWTSPDGEGSFGDESEHAARFEFHGLALVFHTAVELSPALMLHMRLLAQVVAEFYVGKRRESELRRHAYLQAVHETGARLTHDVKNLLQSLYTLTSMAPRDSATGYSGLLQRQLPQITKRLQSTLEKLRSPEVVASDIPVRAEAWWSEVERRMAGAGVALEANIAADGNIPAGLFDTFVENAVDNARAKGEREPGVAIRVRFIFDAERVELSVEDSGSPVPEDVAAHLFREPIERGTGLGIGLFNTARQAGHARFRVELAANRAGEVRFRLAPEDGSGGQR
jgi:signal transduction histidine kinase